MTWRLDRRGPLLQPELRRCPLLVPTHELTPPFFQQSRSPQGLELGNRGEAMQPMKRLPLRPLLRFR